MVFWNTPAGKSQNPTQYHDWMEGTWGKNVKGVHAFWRLKMRHKSVQLCDVGHKALHITSLAYHRLLDVEDIIKMGPQVWYHLKFYLSSRTLSNQEVSSTTQRDATHRLLQATHGTHWIRYAAIAVVYTENGGDMSGVASLSGHAQGAENKEYDILAKVYLKAEKSRGAAAILSGRDMEVPHYDVREMVDRNNADFQTLARALNHGTVVFHSTLSSYSPIPFNSIIIQSYTTQLYDTHSHIPFNSIIVQSYTIQLYHHTIHDTRLLRSRVAPNAQCNHGTENTMGLHEGPRLVNRTAFCQHGSALTPT